LVLILTAGAYPPFADYPLLKRTEQNAPLRKKKERDFKR